MKISKNFVLEEILTQKTKLFQNAITFEEGMANLDPVLGEFSSCSNITYQIYNEKSKKYECFLPERFNNSQEGMWIDASFLKNDIILIKYIREGSTISEPVPMTKTRSNKSKRIVSKAIKKPRSKERTIAEVIEAVKQWRKMHSDENGKKTNLHEIATLLGISKKSLDDYYYQLKLGEKYGFDFDKNADEKIGVLRNFIKNLKPNKSEKIQLSRYPKDLRVFSRLGKKTMQIEKKSQITKESSSCPYSISEEYQEDLLFSENAKKEPNLQDNEFFKQFGFMVEEPMFPFCKLPIDKKKKVEEEFDGEFFC